MRNTPALLVLCSAAALAGPAPELRFGISSASTSPERAAQQASALERYLGQALGKKVVVAISPSFESLATDLAQAKLDAAWMPPFTFVRSAALNKDIQPVAKAIRNGAPLYISVLFARSTQKPRHLQDFKGKTVAWVDELSTSGYLFPMAMLREQAIDPTTYFKEQVKLGSHAAVCKAVAAGEYDLGATFADVPAEGQPLQIDGCRGHADVTKLAVVDIAGTVPNDVIAVRAGLDPAGARAIQALALRLSDSKDGAALLKSVFEANGFEPADALDLDPVKKAWVALGAR